MTTKDQLPPLPELQRETVISIGKKHFPKTRLSCAWFGFADDIARAALQALAQQAQEPVGEVGTMPGTQGFTMACFQADKVPIGTKLYTTPQPQPAPQAVKCRTCSDHGLIGGHLQDGSGYAEPCPDCNAPQATEFTDADEWLKATARTLEAGCTPVQLNLLRIGFNAGKALRPAAQPAVEPLLVRDLAEMIGSSVPEVCKAFVALGHPPHSTNMAVHPDDAVAVAKHLRPQAVPTLDLEAACIGYARLDGNEYKLASMRRNPVMDDGQLHPIYTFSDEVAEAHHGITAQGGEVK